MEADVVANYSGSVNICEPMEIGEKGYITFDQENDMHFIGEDISFGQFKKGDFETKEIPRIE